jgi:glycerol-3-phosphate dehydrogenase (NAD(P)+)
MTKIAVLGAGAWGTALALNLAQRHEVALWTRNGAHLAEMVEQHSNRRYLPDFPFPVGLCLAAGLDAALSGAALALVVTPTAGLRQALRAIAAQAPTIPVIWACKGFEAESACLPHQIAAAELRAGVPHGVLSGPSFAREVAQGLPAALTLASADAAFARSMALQLHSARLRVYSSTDVIGVETGGAVKNVMAIAAGISDGMGYGHNARAALITRGLAEITRLGCALGGRPETFMGLTGVGDLILTCTGDLSRNRTVGLKLAQGKHLDEALGELGHVAEGVNTAAEVRRLAQRENIDMPITEAVCRVLFEDLPPGKAVEALLSRDPKSENL